MPRLGRMLIMSLQKNGPPYGVYISLMASLIFDEAGEK